MLNNVTFSQVDTVDEVAREFNILIDNANQKDAKIEQLSDAVDLLAAEKLSKKQLKIILEAAQKKAQKKAPNKKKGSASVKAIISLVAFFILAGLCYAAYVPTDINYDIASNPEILSIYLRDCFGNITSNSYLFTPTDTTPAAAEGKVYYNDTADSLYLRTASGWEALASAAGNSLDNAYDLGNKIDVDGSALELEVDDGSNNSALHIDHDEATNDNTAFLLENAADLANAISIDIDAQTTGRDIEGTGANWYVTGAGALTLGGGFTISTADCTFDDTYDVIWDTDEDTFLAQDNAKFGFGTGIDVTMKWDTSNLLIESKAEDTGEIRYGSTNAIDVAHYANTNTSIAKFNASTATLEFNGYDVQLQADDKFAFGDSDEFVLEYDEDGDDDLVLVAASANDQFCVGDGTTGTDFVCVSSAGTVSTHCAWFDASGNTNEGIWKFGNDNHGLDVEFYGETGSQLVTWDQSADTWYFGDDAEGVDVYLNANTSGDYVMWDESDEALEAVGAQVHLDDDSVLQLGSTAGDITLQFDGTDFLIDASTADEALKLGDTTTGFDLTYYFEGAGQFRTDYDDDFINLTDDMDLRFGTGGSADGDFQISSNSSDILAIEQVVADTGTITFGADGTDIPIKWYAETASSYFNLTGDDVNIEAMNLALGDGDAILLGDALGTGDFTISSTNAVMTIGQVSADTGTITIGANDHDVPITWHGEAAGADMILTGDTILFDGIDMTFEDTDILKFGDAGADGTITSDGTNIDVTITAAMTLGDGGTTNYAQIAADGEITLVGTAKVTKNHQLSIMTGGGTVTVSAITGAPSIDYNGDGEIVYLTCQVPNDWDAASDLTLKAMVQNAIAEDDGDDVSITWTIHGIADGDTGADAGQSCAMTLNLTGGDQAQNKVNLCSATIDYNEGTYPIAAGDTIVLKGAANLGGGGECTGPLHIVDIWIEYTASKLGTAT